VAASKLSAPRRGAALEWLQAWLVSYGALWAFTLGAAVLVRIVPGGPALAHELLRLSLSAAHNPRPSFAGVLWIAANNSLHSLWPLTLGLIDAQRRRVTRLVADGAVLANLLVAGVLVGGTVGGYGLRALPFLPHVPLEWAGIAVGAAGWAVERKRSLGLRERAFATGLAAAAFLLAATVETCLVPHR
jgi:hypothetical protein